MILKCSIVFRIKFYQVLRIKFYDDGNLPYMDKRTLSELSDVISSGEIVRKYEPLCEADLAFSMKWVPAF